MATKFKLRAQLDDHEPASEASALSCRDPSLTQQSFLEDTDINNILERFMKTGEAPQVIDLPRHGDFTQVNDFQTAMNILVHAQGEFMKLPAKLRARFENDPQQFHDFVLDDNNRDELIKMGLRKPRPEEPLKNDPGDTPGAKTPPAPPKDQKTG